MASPDGLLVPFRGDDGREGVFDIGQTPLPGWHEDLAAAWAARCGPAGTVRTLSSARTAFYAIERVLGFLAALPDAPATVDGLRVGMLEDFHRHRTEGRKVCGDLHVVNQLLGTSPLKEKIDPDVADFIQRRFPRQKWAGSGSGYSEGELARLLAAVRADTAAIRRRIEAGERLLAQARAGQLPEDQAELGRRLIGMAEAGTVPWPTEDGRYLWKTRVRLAGHLFVTLQDLAPLLLLMVALSERNIESVKELSARHRILEGKAVEVELIKRRRGRGKWFETVTWEIGAEGRELHTPGGLYLLLHRLTARSRSFAGGDQLLTIWANGNRRGVEVGPGEHYGPFVKSLAPGLLSLVDWNRGRRQPVLADAPPDAEAPLLQVTAQRLRTSMEARRTKKMGGHLPSAARSNTFPVLFKDYLRGDMTIREWADDVIGEALADAERSALDAHRRALEGAGGDLTVLPGRLQGPAAAGPWSGCRDPQDHPVTRQPCTASLLSCFSCGNCMITEGHLPRLLGLMKSLIERRQRLSEQVWWARYGQAWAAIRHDILTRFSPEQVTTAREQIPDDSLLDWAEDPWEVP
ncbi:MULTISPECIES: hypothetical protein [unclassified Streptomyces]|uniref:hypothetical protein n=1 Tax=unclassified Streptomyces TaxID=2593676 RepID=UPI003824F895